MGGMAPNAPGIGIGTVMGTETGTAMRMGMGMGSGMGGGGPSTTPPRFGGGMKGGGSDGVGGAPEEEGLLMPSKQYDALFSNWTGFGGGV